MVASGVLLEREEEEGDTTEDDANDLKRGHLFFEEDE